MLSRSETGTLKLDSLDLEIILGDWFEKCKNEQEIDWLLEQVSSAAEYIANERTEEL